MTGDDQEDVMNVVSQDGCGGSRTIQDKREKWMVDVIADASCVPGGDRSRIGVAIRINGMMVHWCRRS